eukprot:625072-Rhodomonas_salina.1
MTRIREWLKSNFVCVLITAIVIVCVLISTSLIFYYHFTCNNTAYAEAVLVDNGGSGWEIQWTTAMSRDMYAHHNAQG